MLQKFILFICYSLFFTCLPLHAQQEVNLNLKNVTIEQAIKAIEKQTEYTFMFDNTLDLSAKVTLEFKDASLETILQKMFAGQPISYELAGNQVVLRKVTSGDTQQTAPVRKVTGTVLDEYGMELIGVNVTVKGNHAIGSVTDIDGNFELSVPSDGTLVFSYIGYSPQEVKASAAPLRITMREDFNQIDEVVVVGYGTMQKRAITSSITSVKGSDLAQGVGGASIATALQGKVSGLTISGSSSPNSSNEFQLRGVASINSSKGPLVVIDGIPGGDLRSLNQEDIESIDVLKDASAGAIYGTRAAGGVILVTTKQGYEGPVRLTYTGELTTESVRRRPQVLSAREYIKYGVGGTNYGHDTDWYDELLNKNPLSQRHVFNLTGGSKNARIYSTFMVQDQKGIAIGDSRKDYSGRINANFSMMDGFVEIKTRAEYREANRDKRSTGTDPKGDIFYQSLKLNPTDTPYDPNSPSGYNVMTGGWEYYNPVADINLREDNGKDKWMLADATLKLNFTQELSAQATLGYQGAQWQQNKYVSAQHKASLDNSRRGEGFHRFWRKDEVIFEAQANYLKEMGDHQVSGVAGYSFFETNEEDFEMTNYDFPVDGIGQWDMEKGTWLSDGRANMKSNKKPRHRLMAFLARANYSFRDTYIATASIRREGSSKFGKDHRWGTFYSLSGGWRISNEAFMEDISFINDLKFRVGYGVTGNNGFEANNATKMYSSDSWWIINGDWDYTYGSAHNVNYDLHWEEKTELNFGVDYSVLNNRLFGKFDVYKRKVNGMIYEISVPMPPAIHDKTTMNAGNLQNKGWEFEIGGVPVKNKDFQYMTTMRFSHNTSKITSLWGSNTYQNRKSFPGPGNPGTAIRLQAGMEIGQYHLWRYAGIDDDGEWLLYDENNNVIPARDKKDEDKAFVGNAIPKLIVAWDHTLTYKNWDLSVYLRSWIKYDIFNSINMYYGLSNVENQNVLKDAYTKNKHIKGEKELCDYWLEDGTFLKIDAIHIGYNLDLNLKKYHKWLDKARIYLTVRGVATFTKYSGLNPEVDINGLEPGFEWFKDIYPQTRRYTLGVQLTF